MNATAAARREAQYGSLVSHSLRNLALIWKQVLAYLAAAAVLGVAMPLIGSRSTGVIGLALYFGGQYWLFHTLLKARGLVEVQRSHFLAFVALALLLIIPILFGLTLFLLPGLFLVARWIAAPAFIVARGEGAVAAAGASFDAVRGHTISVMAAIVVLMLIVIAIGTILAGIEGALGSLADSGVLDRLFGHLVPLVLLGLSTATYEFYGPEDTMIEDVFG